MSLTDRSPGIQTLMDTPSRFLPHASAALSVAPPSSDTVCAEVSATEEVGAVVLEDAGCEVGA
eukprot:15080888-Alexandrium_andersonii.AAC.1